MDDAADSRMEGGEGGSQDPLGGRTPAPASRPYRRRWLAALGGVLVLAAVALLAYQIVTWPDAQALATTNPESTAFIDRYRERMREAGMSDDVQWRWVPYDRISQQLKGAVVVSEDIEFFSHGGFSTSEIQAAIREAIEEGDLRGASTITQQLAKNLWLSPSRNPFRKLKEALLTRNLERHLSKERLLEIYLNVVEFGPGIYGAEAAARHYFGKPASQLTRNEAVQLAASLPNPAVWHPGSERSGFHNRVAIIAERMAGYPEFLTRHFGAGMLISRPQGGQVVVSDSLAIVLPAAAPDTVALDPMIPGTANPRDSTVPDTLLRPLSRRPENGAGGTAKGPRGVEGSAAVAIPATPLSRRRLGDSRFAERRVYPS